MLPLLCVSQTSHFSRSFISSGAVTFFFGLLLRYFIIHVLGNGFNSVFDQCGSVAFVVMLWMAGALVDSTKV